MSTVVDVAPDALARVEPALPERLRPLGLFFWGYAWSMTAWCELRDDFRSFRLDRIRAFRELDEPFLPETGRTLEDFFRAMDAAERN